LLSRLRLDEDVIIVGSLNLYRLSSVLFNQCSILLGKCVCALQIAYVYLASGGFAPRPPPGLCPWTPLGDFRPPDPLCPPYLQTLATPLSPKRCKIGPRLLLITNRKSHTRFRLVPKSTTLDDPELTLNGYYALCCITHMSLGAHHKKIECS